jgi:hypothetical protein
MVDLSPRLRLSPLRTMAPALTITSSSKNFGEAHRQLDLAMLTGLLDPSPAP